MKRRNFLQGIGLGAAAGLASGAGVAGQMTTSFSGNPDVIVIGAGVFGSWTAFHLQQNGANVLLVDAFGPGNSRASSGGETRQIQIDSENSVYVRSGIAAFDQWRNLEDESGETLLLETGKLAMHVNEERRVRAEQLVKRHADHGINNTQILTPAEIKHRWPGIETSDLAFGVFSAGGPSGSTLMARRGVRTVANAFVQRGGKFHIARVKPETDSAGNVSGLSAGNDTLRADTYVFACGPWLPQLFPEHLGNRLQVQRRDVLFYGLPPRDDRFAHPNFPCWSIVGSGWYGFPDVEHRGFKAAPYPDVNTIDPDNDERLVTPYQVKRGRDFLGKRFPALGAMPVSESRVCQVTNSIDMNFIVDQLPGQDNVWIVGGGSGHGYKHGPTVGEFAAQRVTGDAYDNRLYETFQLKDETFT